MGESNSRGCVFMCSDDLSPPDVHPGADRLTGERRPSEHAGCVCIGGVPHTDWALQAGVERDEAGYLITGPDLSLNGKSTNKWPLDRSSYHLDTNVPVRESISLRCDGARRTLEGTYLLIF
jgi:hypothetical protein